jgi:hypothetical protein
LDIKILMFLTVVLAGIFMLLLWLKDRIPK